jgi:hypothetical protein
MPSSLLKEGTQVEILVTGSCRLEPAEVTVELLPSALRTKNPGVFHPGMIPRHEGSSVWLEHNPLANHRCFQIEAHRAKSSPVSS